MMLRSNELMIGDWVYYGKKPVKVLQLSEDKDYKHIAPIPLTPEILEKNGFQVTYPTRVGPTFGPKWDIREKKFSIHIEFAGNGTACLEIHNELAPKNEYGAADLITYCRDWAGELYVHELQHALKICGIDKEIVL